MRKVKEENKVISETHLKIQYTNFSYTKITKTKKLPHIQSALEIFHFGLHSPTPDASNIFLTKGTDHKDYLNPIAHAKPFKDGITEMPK